MTVKVGINGMGRIGRMIVRAIIENNNKNIEIKHINNRTNSEACSSLLKYDSIHGKFNAEIGFDKKHLIINKKKISFSQETDLDQITWKKFDVDYVFECTGKFNSKEKLETHLKNGAKKVIVSAPCKNADKTIVYGVNESKLKNTDKIISAASCTTNCLAPVVHVLNEKFEWFFGEFESIFNLQHNSKFVSAVASFLIHCFVIWIDKMTTRNELTFLQNLHFPHLLCFYQGTDCLAIRMTRGPRIVFRCFRMTVTCEIANIMT